MDGAVDAVDDLRRYSAPYLESWFSVIDYQDDALEATLDAFVVIRQSHLKRQ
jgi:hypothetical protein